MTAGSVAVPTIIPLKVPRGPKHVIDSSTQIELRSDTNGSVVLYSVDGSRPEATFIHGRLRIPRTTFVYKSPFLLSPGKIFVKALAMLKDGSKQSSVVTKRFTVNEAQERDDDEESEEDEVLYPRSPSPLPSISSQLRQRLSMSSRVSLASSDLLTDSPPPPQRPSRCASARSQAVSTVSVSRPTTAEKPQPCCVYCKAPRPKTPDYKYCTHCGSRLPPLPAVDPKPPLQLAVCSHCRSHLPPDTTICLVCEGAVERPTPLPPIHGQAGGQSKDKSLCLACGTSNPPNILHCVTCESPLSPEPPTDPPSPTHPPPPLPTPTVMRPVAGSSYMMCGVCGRVNVSDARFCDWCGSKPEGCQLSVMCVGCSYANEWHYRHCFNCGGLIKAPLRPEVELASTMKMPSIAEKDKNAWIPVVEIADKGPETRAVGTQTAGIFYPSSRSLNKAVESQHIQRAVHAKARDRMPQLQDYSPGRGLWRMQVQHMCDHLRAHTQTSTEFQSDIGQPQLGKLVSATAMKQDDRTFSLKLMFDLRPCETKSGRSSRAGSTTSLQSTSVISMSSTFHIATPTKKKSTRKRSSNQTTPVHKLKCDVDKMVEELSVSGQGRREVVEELIRKGVNVNSTDKSGLPLLSLAASNGHLECIGALIDGGAVVNSQQKSTGNTALHQAVLTNRVDSIETLLGYSANPRLKNRSGLNPCDLAIKLNNDGIVTCFATYVGAGLLEQLAKSQPSLTL